MQNIPARPLGALPADIVLTRGHGFLSRAIRFFTRSIGEPRTQVNHVGIIVEAGDPLGNAILVEALTKVRRHSLDCSYGDGRTDVAIYRPENLSDDEWNLDVKLDFEYRVKIQLYDIDNPGFPLYDDHDHRGTLVIRPHQQRGSGTFNQDGADYVLEWQ